MSHSTSGALTGANGQADTPSISHDGRYVLYGSHATDLVSGFTDGNGGLYDVYVFDRTTGTNTLVTRTPGSATTGLNGDALDASITPDGRYAVVNSRATNLMTFTDNNGSGADFFLTPIGTGSYQLISHAPGSPTQGSGASSETAFNSVLASTSAGKVIFNSVAINLVTGFSDENVGETDTYIWDRGSDTIKLVSHEFGSATRGGNGGGASGFEMGISADGSLVAYTNTSTSLIPGFTGSGRNVYTYDTSTGENTLLSHDPANPLLAANDESLGAFPTADGRFVPFVSLATNLISGFSDNNGGVRRLVPARPDRLARAGVADAAGDRGHGRARPDAHLQCRDVERGSDVRDLVAARHGSGRHGVDLRADRGRRLEAGALRRDRDDVRRLDGGGERRGGAVADELRPNRTAGTGRSARTAGSARTARERPHPSRSRWRRRSSRSRRSDA